MEKIELKKEINFTEENLMRILEGIVFSENINLNGEETDEFIGIVQDYIGKTSLDSKVIFQLEDYCTEIADHASAYAYKEGFKEGVRLLKTLLAL